MEEPAVPSSCEDKWSDDFSQSLSARRQQAVDLMAAQRQQFEQIEAELDSHLAALEQRITAGISDADGVARIELDGFAQTLRKQAEELSQQQAALTADRAEIASRQGEIQLAREQLARQHQELADHKRVENEQLERRVTELAALEAKARQLERALVMSQEEHEQEVKQHALRKARSEEQQQRLEKELEELEARREETRTQRRRIAQQLKIERTALKHERDLNRAELERQRAGWDKEADRGQRQLREERATFEQEMNRGRQQLHRDRAQLEEDLKTLEESRHECEESRRQLEKNRGDQSADLRAAHQEIERLTLLLSERPSGSSENDAARAQRVQELEAQLAETKHKLAERPAAVDSQHFEDLQRRFEMAVDDVRQLKRRNAELEEQVAARPAEAAAPARSAAGAHEDWETTKRRLMAELSDEANQSEGGLVEDDRLTVEGAIRITDDVVHQRDREIAELKELLAQQSGQAVAAESTATQKATAELLDQDAVIQQERQRLLEMQNEWQEKLRQAEVEISVQRARIARERSDIDEKLRIFEEQKSALAAQQSSGETPASDKPGKPARRWLSRLGLKENDKD